MNYEKEIKKISKILNISSPKIINNPYLAFSYMDNVIYYEKIDDKYKLLFLLFHELRHHFQYLYIKNNISKLSNIWKYEMDNYDLNHYLDYDIELDAYSFSYLILKYYYNYDYKLPLIIKNKVLDYINKNMERFNFIYKE